MKGFKYRIQIAENLDKPNCWRATIESINGPYVWVCDFYEATNDDYIKTGYRRLYDKIGQSDILAELKQPILESLIEALGSDAE